MIVHSIGVIEVCSQSQPTISGGGEHLQFTNFSNVIVVEDSDGGYVLEKHLLPQSIVSIPRTDVETSHLIQLDGDGRPR